MLLQDWGPDGPLSFGTLPVPKKKEKQMRTEIGSIHLAATEAPKDEARDHLLERLRYFRQDHINSLWAKYVSEDSPKTIGEAKEWVKKGLFKLEFTEHLKDDAAFCPWNYSFHWGKKIADREAFSEAKEKVNAAYDAATDIIMVKTDADARLKALKDFQAWKE